MTTVHNPAQQQPHFLSFQYSRRLRGLQTFLQHTDWLKVEDTFFTTPSSYMLLSACQYLKYNVCLSSALQSTDSSERNPVTLSKITSKYRRFPKVLQLQNFLGFTGPFSDRLQHHHNFKQLLYTKKRVSTFSRDNKAMGY